MRRLASVGSCGWYHTAHGWFIMTRYWVNHLQRSQVRLYDNDQVHKFLHKHFIHWFEALSSASYIGVGASAPR